MHVTPYKLKNKINFVVYFTTQILLLWVMKIKKL